MNGIPDVPARALANLSDHLRAILDDVARVERAILALQSRHTCASTQDVVELQRIDMVQQTLEDLATLTGLMAQGRATPDTVGRALNLAATRALLVEEDASQPPQVSGELDLF